MLSGNCCLPQRRPFGPPTVIAEDVRFLRTLGCDGRRPRNGPRGPMRRLPCSAMSAPSRGRRTEADMKRRMDRFDKRPDRFEIAQPQRLTRIEGTVAGVLGLPFPELMAAPRTPQPSDSPAPGSRGYRGIRSNTKTIGRREGRQEHGRGIFLQFRRRHYADRQLPSPVEIPSRFFLPCIRRGVGAFRHKILRNPQKLSTGRRRRCG